MRQKMLLKPSASRSVEHLGFFYLNEKPSWRGNHNVSSGKKMSTTVRPISIKV